MKGSFKLSFLLISLFVFFVLIQYVCAQWGPDEQKHRQASRLNHDANEYKGDMHYQEKVKIKQKRYYTSRNNYKSWNAAPVGAVRKNLRTQSDDVI